MHVEMRQAIDPVRARALDTAGLRNNFLVDDLFSSGEIRFVYSHYERLMVGGAVPTVDGLALSPARETGTEFFLARREIAAVNVGGAGRITARGKTFDLAPRDVLYVGKDVRDVVFHSVDPGEPARFYLLSAPAHMAHPTRLLRIADAKRIDLGSPETSNQRSIYQMIIPGVCDSCQLVLGITELAPGSVWNTMPAHVHDRRSEVYLYFDLTPGQKVIHLMGEPTETRHLVVGDREAVLSPPWSIHCGAGTGAYTFIWGMGGDNVDYTDMDKVDLGELR